MTSFLKKIPIVGSLISPKQPRIPERAPLPPPPRSIADIDPKAVNASEADKKAAQIAAAEKRRKLRGQAGRKSTFRTGALGAVVPSGNIARKTLLGA